NALLSITGRSRVNGSKFDI
uniref:Uncharacterized protein n=1 Tax=Acrobeloides nanus TaxID=290746 RepID=A0A914DIH3_9BILA